MTPSADRLDFFASDWTRMTAWFGLVFWVFFLGIWIYELATDTVLWTAFLWAFIALIGLLLQVLRIRSFKNPQVSLEGSHLIALGLLGNFVRHDLALAHSLSVLQRRSKATLFLKFMEKNRKKTWLFMVSELEAPREFVQELAARVPLSHVDGSIQRYLKDEDRHPPGGEKG